MGRCTNPLDQREPSQILFASNYVGAYRGPNRRPLEKILVPTATTGEEGLALFAGLAPSSYQLLAWSGECDGCCPPGSPGQLSAPAEIIALLPGQQQRRTLHLMPTPPQLPPGYGGLERSASDSDGARSPGGKGVDVHSAPRIMTALLLMASLLLAGGSLSWCWACNSRSWAAAE